MVSRLRVTEYMRLMDTPLPIIANGSRVKYRFGIGATTILEDSDTRSTSELDLSVCSSVRLMPSMVFRTKSLVSG